MNQDKFTQYGKTFQLKIIAALLKDKLFLQQIYDILIPEYFDSEANTWIVNVIMKYFPEYKTVPTLEVFKVKALELTNEPLKMSIVDSLKEILRYVEAEDLEFVKSECINFCKNQCIKTAIIESVELLQSGEYDNIKKKIDNAMKAGANQDIGMDYLKDIKQRYEESARKTLATPWTAFNELVDGGIGKGELIIFVAGPGAGKCIGPNTSIDIQYEELGIEMINSQGVPFIFWIDPFVIYEIDNHKVQGIEVINLLQGLNLEK
jgi:hypothetical protein